jgi:type I site-specific restriction endonuclease
MSTRGDRRTFRNEDLVLKVTTDIDPKVWDESGYEAFLDELCGTREYQKEAIRTTLRYLLGGKYANLRALARKNFDANEELQQRYGSWTGMERHLQLPDQLSCSIDQATGTGKSYVLYGLAAILLAEGTVDRVLVLCPSNTIEAGLLGKFRELAANSDLRDLLPPEAKVKAPKIINASETIVDGSICVENYHAILETVKSSIRDSLMGKGARVAEDLKDFLVEWEKLSPEEAGDKVLPVSSSSKHQANVAKLRLVDKPASQVEWIVSVSMLSEGWDVKNAFQIVPHEERAFNSKLLIAQVLGRGLRRPGGWQGEDPMVTVFNHDAWSGRIKHLVNEILEIERRLTSTVDPASPHNFELHNLDYTRVEDTSEYAKKGEYRLLEQGFVDLPTQVEAEDVTVEFERAVTGEHTKFKTQIRHKTWSVEDVAEQMFQRLKSIDEESKEAKDPQDRTSYARKFPLEMCEEIVRESLKRAKITTVRITDENRQKFLQALGTLRRKSAKQVLYKLSANALVRLNTCERQAAKLPWQMSSENSFEKSKTRTEIFWLAGSRLAIAVTSGHRPIWSLRMPGLSARSCVCCASDTTLRSWMRG